MKEGHVDELMLKIAACTRAIISNVPAVSTINISCPLNAVAMLWMTYFCFTVVNVFSST